MDDIQRLRKLIRDRPELEDQVRGLEDPEAIHAALLRIAAVHNLTVDPRRLREDLVRAPWHAGDEMAGLDG